MELAHGLTNELPEEPENTTESQTTPRLFTPCNSEHKYELEARTIEQQEMDEIAVPFSFAVRCIF